jgi:hypothetical protein
MMLFMLGIVAGIALCCLVEFLYNHISLLRRKTK